MWNNLPKTGYHSSKIRSLACQGPVLPRLWISPRGAAKALSWLHDGMAGLVLWKLGHPLKTYQRYRKRCRNICSFFWQQTWNLLSLLDLCISLVDPNFSVLMDWRAAEPKSWPSNISHMVLFGDIGKPKQIMAASDAQRRCEDAWVVFSGWFGRGLRQFQVM